MKTAQVIIPLSSPRQYKALLALMNGPHSVRDLFDTIPCNGVPQLIASLRAKGLQIDTIKHTTRSKDGSPIAYAVYVLNPKSLPLACKLLAAFAE